MPIFGRGGDLVSPQQTAVVLHIVSLALHFLHHKKNTRTPRNRLADTETWHPGGNLARMARSRNGRSKGDRSTKKMSTASTQEPAQEQSTAAPLMRAVDIFVLLSPLARLLILLCVISMIFTPGCDVSVSASLIRSYRTCEWG